MLAFAEKYPKQMDGLVIGGLETSSEVDLEDDLVIKTLKQGTKAWLNLWQQMLVVPDSMTEQLLNCHALALVSLRIAGSTWSDLATALPNIHVPTLVYAGENCFFNKQTQEIAKNIENSQYIEHPKSNHFELMLESTWICNHVATFFKKN